MDPNGVGTEAEVGAQQPRRSAMRRRSAQQQEEVTSDHPVGRPPRPPPSAFSFPFQAYPGNPDPGTPMPSRAYMNSSRRSSTESLSNINRRSLNSFNDQHDMSSSVESDARELSRPTARFMIGEENAATADDAEIGHTGGGHGPGSPQNTLYRNSIGASIASKGSNSNLKESSRNSMTFRAPFLSPPSRSPSSLWTPPVYPYQQGPEPSPTESTAALGSAVRNSKAPLPSTALHEKLSDADKPWLASQYPNQRLPTFLTRFFFLLGLAGAALLIFFDIRSVNLLDESTLCVVLEDTFNSGSLDTSVWKRTVELGGFGNGEFEIMTNKDENLKVQNGNLYIIPTLTSEDIGGTSSLFDGYDYDLQGDCTTDNKTACSVKSDLGSKTVIPPVQSARISTNGTKSIRYGRVQVRAKLPRGDWLWPAIWMLPKDDTYGAWPMSGEIDIMESRGNDASYPAQGFNFVRSALNYGPLPTLRTQIFGWWSFKRGGFNEAFHTYTLEWSPNWMRVYVDSRLQATLDLSIKKEKQSFFERGKYSPTAMDIAGQVVPVTNIWNSSWSAPFDQDFYLILSVAAGGTSGWFPDNVGGKPWTDGSGQAMYDFAKAQSDWSATWPTSEDDRALRVDWVKIWGMC